VLELEGSKTSMAPRLKNPVSMPERAMAQRAAIEAIDWFGAARSPAPRFDLELFTNISQPAMLAATPIVGGATGTALLRRRVAGLISIAICAGGPSSSIDHRPRLSVPRRKNSDVRQEEKRE
jgi:lipopolysaccharide export LptBFGC system permease protein LptF